MARKKDGRPAWFKVFRNQRSTIDAVPDAAAGQALKAAFHYADTGEVPTLEPIAAVVFAAFREHIDEANSDYQKASKAGQKGNEIRWSKGSGGDTTRYHMTQSVDTSTEADAETDEDEEEKTDGEEISPQADIPLLTRCRYGEYNNVLLSADEYAKLEQLFPYDLSERIERLSEYIASTGKKYKSHYATIRSWANRDGKQQLERPTARGGYAGQVGPNGIAIDPTKNDLDGIF